MIWGLNKNRFTLESGRIILAGQIEVMGLYSFTPKEELTGKELIHANGQRSVGKTKGKLKGNADMELLLTEYDQLVQYLGDGFGDEDFDIVAHFSEPGSDGEYTVGVSGASILSSEQGLSNDGKAIVQKIGLLITDPIDWNGVKMIRDDGSFLDPLAFGLSFF